MKSILVGVATAFVVFALFILYILWREGRNGAAIGMAVFQSLTLRSPLFWIVMLLAFGTGFFLTHRFRTD